MIERRTRTWIAGLCVPVFGALIAIAVVNVSTNHEPAQRHSPGIGSVQTTRHPNRIEARSVLELPRR